MTRLNLSKKDRERLGVTEGGAAPKFANEQAAAVDGRVFDSKAEARRYQELRLLEQAGAIADLTCQPQFALVDKSRHGGALYYVGDFGYFECGRRVVEEVKGFETPVWRLKRRLFLERYPDVELRVLKEPRDPAAAREGRR